MGTFTTMFLGTIGLLTGILVYTIATSILVYILWSIKPVRKKIKELVHKMIVFTMKTIEEEEPEVDMFKDLEDEGIII